MVVLYDGWPSHIHTFARFAGLFYLKMVGFLLFHIPSFSHTPLVLKILEVFCQIWAWRSSWSCNRCLEQTFISLYHRGFMWPRGSGNDL